MFRHLILILIPATFGFYPAAAQIPKIHTAIRQVVGTNGTVNMPGYLHFWSLPKENQTFVFSAIITVDQNGKVSDVSYSGRTPLSDTTLKFPLISSLLRKDKHAVFRKFKNAVIIAPIWIKEEGTTLVKTTPEFLNSFEELIPQSYYRLSKKKLWILPMTIIGMYKPIP
jgi:hypothetical protein